MKATISLHSISFSERWIPVINFISDFHRALFFSGWTFIYTASMSNSIVSKISIRTSHSIKIWGTKSMKYKPSFYVNLLKTSVLSWSLEIKIYKNIIFTVVLNGCETWSLTLREKYRLRVFEKGVLRRIFVFGQNGIRMGSGEISQRGKEYFHTNKNIGRFNLHFIWYILMLG